MELLSEFEAAIEFKLSPVFLRWCTSYSPKNDKKKLNYVLKDGLYYFSKADLIDFNTYLSEPWPKTKKEDGRPYMPVGVQNEIKAEAQFECPICHRTPCEVAHIEPVSVTLNNHPHNLIFLCTRHHTEYDYGFVYNNVLKEDILHFKETIQKFQIYQWTFASEKISSYMGLLNKIAQIKDQELEFTKALKPEAIDDLFKLIVESIAGVKARAIKNKNQNAEAEAVIESVNKKNPPKDVVAMLLDVKGKVEDIYTKDKNLLQCPVCNGKGHTSYFEICPPCEGEGYLTKKQYNTIDFDNYELIDCELCQGKGTTDYFDICPPCGGEGQLTKEQAGEIDFERFDLVECQLCEGKGDTPEFDICPPCKGDGYLTREKAAETDFDVFEFVECPLCEGKGDTKNFDVCPACKGEGQLTNEQVENIDFSQFNFITCKLCKGKGDTDDFDVCPACHGEGTLTVEQSDNIDFSRFEFVKCPLCKGKGETKYYEICPPCGGNGKVTNEQYDNIDLDDYRR